MAEYTIGELRIDGVVICDALEPVDRQLLRQQPPSVIREAKKQGKTAIPLGRYSVRLCRSATFRAMRPYVIDVPGFSGIMIHEGNTVADTHGCILVGRNTRRGMVLESRKCLKVVMDRIAEAEYRDEAVCLTIKKGI